MIVGNSSKFVYSYLFFYHLSTYDGIFGEISKYSCISIYVSINIYLFLSSILSIIRKIFNCQSILAIDPIGILGNISIISFFYLCLHNSLLLLCIILFILRLRISKYSYISINHSIYHSLISDWEFENIQTIIPINI